MLAAVPALESGPAIGTGRRRRQVRRVGRGALGQRRDALLLRQGAVAALQGRRASAHPRDRAGASTARAATLSVIFAPHLVPMSRGLLSTVYLEVEAFTTEEAVELYRGRYHEEPFVYVHEAVYAVHRRGAGHQPGASASWWTRRTNTSSSHARSTTSARAPRARPCSASTPFLGIPRPRVRPAGAGRVAATAARRRSDPPTVRHPESPMNEYPDIPVSPRRRRRHRPAGFLAAA